VVPTSLGYARNALVASAPDVLIAVHGSVGTLSEVAMALNYRKPVILVDSGGIAGELEKINFSKEYAALVRHCTAEDAVEAASKLIR